MVTLRRFRDLTMSETELWQLLYVAAIGRGERPQYAEKTANVALSHYTALQEAADAANAGGDDDSGD